VQEAVAADAATPPELREEARAFLRGELVFEAVTERGAVEVNSCDCPVSQEPRCSSIHEGHCLLSNQRHLHAHSRQGRH